MVGQGPLLDAVVEAWARAAGRVERREARQGPDYAFDPASLSGLDAGVEAFVAFDARFLQHKRLELIALVRARGARLVPVIAPGATCLGQVADNVFVADGAFVAADAKVGEGAILGARCVVGAGAAIGAAAWLETGVIVGAGARVGAQTLLGLGVQIAAQVEIGERCVIDVPGVYRASIAPRTFYAPGFDGPVRIVGG